MEHSWIDKSQVTHIKQPKTSESYWSETRCSLSPARNTRAQQICVAVRALHWYCRGMGSNPVGTTWIFRWLWECMRDTTSSPGSLFLYFRRRVAARHKRRAWIFPLPQNWFQRLLKLWSLYLTSVVPSVTKLVSINDFITWYLKDRVIDHWWKENFREPRRTFELICQLVGTNMERQNTRMREAISVDKRVSARLWRLATGECYRSCGLLMGLAKPTAISCCHEFVQELFNFQNEFITFPSARADVIKKVQDFPWRVGFKM